MKKIICALVIGVLFVGSTATSSEDVSTSSQRYQGLNLSSIPAGYTAAQYYQTIQEDIYFLPTIPTTSINEDFIETTFGATGANLDTSVVTKIKQAYCFLEFLYKLDQVQNNNDYTNYQTDYSDYLNNSTSTIFLPTATLVASPGWTNISVTAENLQASDAWQLFIKTLITNCFINDYTTIEILHQVKCQIFSYIPNIETSYYTTDFSNLRNLEEVTRIKSLLHSNMRNFYLAQCADWKNETVSNLGSDILAFKQSSFFTAVSSTGISTDSSDSSTDTTTTSALLQSPIREQAWCYFMFLNIISELYAAFSLDNLNFILNNISSTQISPCFTDVSSDDLAVLYDFYLLQENNTSTTTSDADANAVLDAPASSTSSTTVTAQELSDSTASKNKSARRTRNYKTRGKKYRPEELRKTETLAFAHRNHPLTQKNRTAPTAGAETKEVIAQDFWSDLGGFFTDAQQEITAEGEAIWSGLQAAGSAIVDFWNSIGETIVGWGTCIAGDFTGDQSLIAAGTALENQGQADAEAGLAQLDIMIDDFGTAIKDGIAFDADIDGAFVAFVTGDIQSGEDTAEIINNVADQIVDIIDEALILVTNTVGEYEIGEMRLEENLTNVIIDSVMAMVTSGSSSNSTYVSDLSTDALNLIKGIGESILDVCTALYDSGKAIIESVMTLLSTVVNSITTIFIDVIRDVTYVFSAIAQELGANVNADELRDEVTTTLNDNRSTINEVVGVVIAVAITVAVIVCTAGAGAGVAAGIDAALIGGAEAGAAAADAGLIAADTAAVAGDVAEDAALAAEEAADVAADIAGDVAEDVAEDVGEDVAEDVGEDAAEDAEDDAEDDTEDDDSDDDTEDGDDDEEEDDDDQVKKKSGAGAVFGQVIKFLGEAINSVFQFFSIVSGVNADDSNRLKKELQEDSLRSMWNTIGITKTYNIQSQAAFMNEVMNKQSAAISNQKLGLIFYQNYLNSSLDNSQKTIAQDLAIEQISLLTPNSNGLQSGNIGSETALVTPFFDLYPSEGFTFATAGRPEFPFSQEIAATPTTTTSSTSDSSTVTAQSISSITLDGITDSTASTSSNTTASSSGSTTEKFWFNQRAVASVDQAATDPLNVEMKFNIIYTLNAEFHAGIFVGGTYYDYSSADYLSEIKTNQAVDLDTIHLAKLFVISRDSGTAAWQIGVYEPEGAGWLTQETLDPAFYTSPDTYHMSANLNGTALTVTFWGESNPSNTWTKTLDVAVTDQRPYGVIFSGLALEWNMVSPAVSYTKNSSRATCPQQTEINRSKTAIATRQKNLAPTFGSFTLSTITNRQALSQQYIYETTSTQLTDPQGNTISDFVVFATNTGGTISNIGTNPSDSTANAVVSLISGNVFDVTGNIVTTQSGVWAAYQSTYLYTDASIVSQIESGLVSLISNIINISLGSSTLTAASTDMLLNNQYVYTSSETITDGSDIVDYLTPCTITSAGKLSSSYGYKPATSNQAFVSFVTGNLFDGSGAIVKTGYSIVSTYQAAHGTLSDDILTAIAASTSAWQAAVTAEAAAAAAAEDTPAADSITVDASSISNGTAASTDSGISDGTTDANLQDRATSAASSVGLQLSSAGVSSGMSLSLSF